MNSYDLNNPIQNQRQQYSNYIPGSIENSIQTPAIKNTNQDQIQIKKNINIPCNLGI